jgi:myosin protein heavy chain
MEKNIKELRERSSELQTALRLETSARISENDANRRLSVELKTMASDNKDLNSSLQSLEQERLALEAEARGNGEQLREMAEKVFQLLERVKLAELGKKKSTEALSRKEQELFATKKQYNRLSEDVLDQKRRREKIEIEKRALEEQLRGLKKANNQLGHKLKEEAKLRIKAEEAAQVSDEKVHKLDGRIAFLLNKLQLDEETITVQQEEMKKVDTQLQAITVRCESLQGKLTQAEEYGRATDAKLKTSQKELKDVKINLEAMERSIKAKEAVDLDVERRALRSTSADKGGTNGSRQSRFYVDFRSSVGHAAITSKFTRDKAWIEERGCNSFLRRTFKSHNPQEALVKKMAEMYNTISFDEEDKEELQRTIKSRDKDIESLNRELTRIQTNVCSQEESKRRILLRYIRAVKASVSL